jgi:orotate phosphoribosyltransferase
MTIAEEVAKILLEIKAVSINTNQPYRYSSGMLSPVYSDHRLLMSYPAERTKVISFLADKMNEVGLPDIIAGTATAGIPHAAWLADTLTLPMIYARSKPKEHGKQNLIEGLLQKGKTVYVVEDLISTAKSSIETVLAVRNLGGIADHIFAINTYGLEQADKNLAEQSIILTTLTSFSEVLPVAVEKQKVLDWFSDPEGWGKKNGFE